MILDHVVFDNYTEAPPDIPSYVDAAYRNSDAREKAHLVRILTSSWGHIPGRFGQMLKEVSRGEGDRYIVFIITINQEPLWQAVVDRYKLEQYIHYQTKEWVANSRYPDMPPRLKTIILKFPKGVSFEA